MAARTDQISSSEIKLLLVLCERTSFTAVALELGLTQSAVSKAILALEERCGAELVSRGRFGCAPGAFLKSMQPALRRADQALNNLQNELYHPRGFVSGKVVIAGFRSAINLLLPPAIGKLLERHPELDISLRAVREVGGGVLEHVLQGRADVGVTTNKPPAAMPSCLLGFDHYVLVCRRERSNTGSLRNPAFMRRIVLWNENCSACVPDILESEGIRPQRIIRVDDDTTVLNVILHGGGFTIMPRLATEPLPAALESRVLKHYKRRIWLCGQETLWASLLGRVLRRKILSTARELVDGY